MDLESFRSLCLALPHTEECTPFGPEALVYKVGGKMFALTSPDDFPVRINLKCDPDRALELRDRYESVLPGYHMNKRHWNTIILDGTVPAKLLKELVQHSYDLVIASLTSKVRQSLQMDKQV